MGIGYDTHIIPNTQYPKKKLDTDVCYGIRNNKITKLKKEIDNGFEHVQVEKTVLNSSVIIRLLDNLGMDDSLSSLIKETLNEVIDKYKIT